MQTMPSPAPLDKNFAMPLKRLKIKKKDLKFCNFLKARSGCGSIDE